MSILTLNAVQALGSKILGPCFKDRNWYKVLFSVRFGFLNARNKTMAENIRQAFQEN